MKEVNTFIPLKDFEVELCHPKRMFYLFKGAEYALHETEEIRNIGPDVAAGIKTPIAETLLYISHPTLDYLKHVEYISWL